MFFEDLTAGADPNAPGALPLPEPIVAKAEENGTANGANAAGRRGRGRRDVEAAGADGSGAERRGTDATAAAAPAATPAKEEKVGIIKGENGAEYWLGRVNRVRGGDDPWENTQVIFDSDPDGEEPMWVCPWEIELAPEEYQPKDEDYRPFGAAGGGGGAEEERSQADQAKVDAGQAIAEAPSDGPREQPPRERSSTRGARRRTPTGPCRDRRRCSAAQSSICTASWSR